MNNSAKAANKLINETSPYLLQHAYNPVAWYPWCEEAFEKAKKEDKPIFLSIGYSTCHWCHVLAHESFESEDVANILNEKYVCIKVDKEERPDVDLVYMRVCQAFTGGGGWPNSIFMSWDQKPFYAGTYFPKQQLIQILNHIDSQWQSHKEKLMENSEEFINSIRIEVDLEATQSILSSELIQKAISIFEKTFDSVNGGFGQAPKFPSPHNLLFLLDTASSMGEKTLLQMYKGGIFDHIGFGFSRYSTDNLWLAPHFEKMLYDNALLCLAYLSAFEKTGNSLYRSVAEKVFTYVERELTDPQGGFYSAQDADSEGEEGKYYVFSPDEILKVLGEAQGSEFNQHFDITRSGNFEGKSIPNILHQEQPHQKMDHLLQKVYDYRKNRMVLHKDHKILTSWNALMIAALAEGYRILRNPKYLSMADKALWFIEGNLMENTTLYTNITEGKRGCHGFLDDYAFLTYALLLMYQATANENYLNRALGLTDRAIIDYYDKDHKGFYFSGQNNEKLIFNVKETYDGAIPSGNSVMFYNLLQIYHHTGNEKFHKILKEQKQFMNTKAYPYPAGYGFYLYSLNR